MLKYPLMAEKFTIEKEAKVTFTATRSDEIELLIKESNPAIRKNLLRQGEDGICGQCPLGGMITVSTEEGDVHMSCAHAVATGILGLSGIKAVVTHDSLERNVSFETLAEYLKKPKNQKQFNCVR